MDAAIIIGLAFASAIGVLVVIFVVTALTAHMVRGVRAMIHRRRQAWRELRQQVDQIRHRQSQWASDAVCEQSTHGA